MTFARASGLFRATSSVPVPTVFLQRQFLAGLRPMALPARAISRPSDAAELAAERTADTLLAGTTPAPSPLAPARSRSPMPDLTGLPPLVGEVIHGSGRPLDAATRAEFEPRLGADLGHVRVHTGDRAASSAEAVSAHGYTVGSDVVLGRTADRRTLAHELAHAVGAGEGARLHRQSTAAEEEERPGRNPGRAEMVPGAGAVERIDLSGSSGGGGGAPGPGIPDCTAVMGGRQVEHWFAGDVMGANHTYVNFKESASDYWLVEAGPLPGDPTHVGAWAKHGSWEHRGNRVGTTYTTPQGCATAKAAILDTQRTYHAAGLSYDPSKGPNSNSFTEQLVSKAPVLALFTPWDWRWDYWRSHPRPF